METLNLTHSLTHSLTHVYHFSPLMPHLIVQRENLTGRLSLFPALVKALETHVGKGVCVCVWGISLPHPKVRGSSVPCNIFGPHWS